MRIITDPVDHPRDVHVYPTYGREHDTSCQCWCEPELDCVGESGAQLWVHREDN